MAKKGGSRHCIRITTPRSLPISGRKSVRWLLCPEPGPHAKGEALSAAVLLRDVLSLAEDAHEVKRMLVAGHVLVDGKKLHSPRAGIGLMDVIEIPKAGKAYRMQIVNGQLRPKEITATQAKMKLCKVTGKKTLRGGKTILATHDGRTMNADEGTRGVKVGSTIVMAVPGFKPKSVLPLSAGVKCLVTKGKHAGELAVLEKIIERTGSMDSEAELKSGPLGFITLTKYLFVVDNEFA